MKKQYTVEEARKKFIDHLESIRWTRQDYATMRGITVSAVNNRLNGDNDLTVCMADFAGIKETDRPKMYEDK